MSFKATNDVKNKKNYYLNKQNNFDQDFYNNRNIEQRIFRINNKYTNRLDQMSFQNMDIYSDKTIKNSEKIKSKNFMNFS